MGNNIDWERQTQACDESAYGLGLADLVGALHVSRALPIRAYLDESEPPERIFTVAGFVAQVPIWDKFERQWRRVLNRYGIREFHATDFESFRGEFSGWSRDRKEQVYRELLPVLIHAHALHVAVAIPLTDYERLDDADRETLGPAPVCATRRCFELAAAWLRTRKIKPPIAYVLDDGGKFKGAVMKAYDEAAALPSERKYLRLGGFAFGNSACVLPLQAADWAAFEAAKHARVHLRMPDTRTGKAGQPWPVRYVWQDYFDRLVASLGQLQAERLYISDLLDRDQLMKLAENRRRDWRSGCRIFPTSSLINYRYLGYSLVREELIQ